VRDLRRTAFSSRCRPIASSPRRRLVDRELSPEPVGFDGLGRVPAREQIVHCLIPTGERKPRVGHREMKFAAMKFACFLSRQQTLCRVIAVASRIVHFSLYSQAQKTCDYYDHDHQTDDVKDVHCVLLRVRDANPLEGWQICDWVHPGSSCHGCQSVVEATMRSSTNVSLYRIAHCNLLRSELVCLIHWPTIGPRHHPIGRGPAQIACSGANPRH
jgi:hypothetical protein